MTYNEFKQYICQTLKTTLESGDEVIIQNILKNNDTHLDGLTVISPSTNISPTIYLNHYYEQYKNGTALADICKEISEACRENRTHTPIDVSFFTDYEKVKSHIIFKLVNYERNKELLEQLPHFRYLDLAIVFCCLLQPDSTGTMLPEKACGSILIYRQHLKLWDITEDDLYTLARFNTPRLLRYDLRDMRDIFNELFTGENGDEQALDTDTEDPCPTYLLTNQSKMNGSACILYPDLLKDLSAYLDSDLYILPSSVHEVLVLPANINSREELTEMVEEMNATQLSPEEVLSDHIYYFSRDTGELTM